MFNAIPGWLLLDIAKSQGYMEQLDLDLDTAPLLTIDEEYLTSVNIKIDIVGNTKCPIKTMSSADHQAFTIYRNWLANNGYIKKEESWTNGDVVLKPFYVNGYLFEEDESFPCGVALGGKLKVWEKYKNADDDTNLI